MIYGTINNDRLCKVLEQIFSERDGGEFEITVISENDKEVDVKEKTA